MTLRELEYVVAIARYGSFAGAAEALNVSQSTLSIQLKKLEETLGVMLFERRSKLVRLSPAGKAVLPAMQRVLLGVDGIRLLAREAAQPMAGVFTLGAFPTLAPYWFPGAVRALKKALPDLQLRLVEEKTDVLRQQLLEGVVDAAVLALPEQTVGLQSTILFKEEFLLAMPQGHPLASQDVISPRTLEGRELLLLEDGHCLRGQALAVCAESGSREQQGYRATSMETLRNMVAAGEGLTLMPQCAIRAGDGNVYRPLAPNPPGRTLALFSRSSSVRQQTMRAIVAALQHDSLVAS